MPILSSGVPTATNVTFNSGILDVNGYDLAVLQDVTVTIAVSVKEIRALGTIKMVTAPKRSTFKVSAKAKVKSINKEVFGAFLGSSGPDGSGQDFVLFDGQNVLSRASIKCIINESSSNTVEWQFTNAIISGSLASALKMEEAGEMDIEIEAQDVTVVTNF